MILIAKCRIWRDFPSFLSMARSRAGIMTARPWGGGGGVKHPLQNTRVQASALRSPILLEVPLFALSSATSFLSVVWNGFAACSYN